MKRIVLVLLAVSALLVVSCSDDETDTPTDGAASTDEDVTESTDGSGDDDTTDTAATEISVVDFAFDPDSTSVAVGETVTWSNTGSATHTATSTELDFDSGELAQGDTFSFTATEAGEFAFFCDIHSSMTGTLTVSN